MRSYWGYKGSDASKVETTIQAFITTCEHEGTLHGASPDWIDSNYHFV